MPRYYFEHAELIDDTWVYCVYDNRLGGEIARCDRGDDAEKIVDALNADRKPGLGIFG